jgi:hypothetical protein
LPARRSKRLLTGATTAGPEIPPSRTVRVAADGTVLPDQYFDGFKEGLEIAHANLAAARRAGLRDAIDILDNRSRALLVAGAARNAARRRELSDLRRLLTQALENTP